MIIVTVDRIEGFWAVLLTGEDGAVEVDVPAALLPEGTEEGSRLTLELRLALKSGEKCPVSGQYQQLTGGEDGGEYGLTKGETMPPGPEGTTDTVYILVDRTRHLGDTPFVTDGPDTEGEGNEG